MVEFEIIRRIAVEAEAVLKQTTKLLG